MSITLSIDLNSIYYLPDWICHPTLVDNFLFQSEHAEQAGRAKGWRPAQACREGILQQRDRFARSAIEVRCSRCEAPKPIISINNDNDRNNDKTSNNDGNDNLNDGTEDTNHNGRIDGDNGDGIYQSTEYWTETNPNEKDTDGDSFEDKFEKDHQYNPLSKDTDGDGLPDNEEDEDGDGSKDSNETSVKLSDTDGDGLSDKMEIDGWIVIIIKEATLEIDEERDVTSNPLLPDYDGDGINDCGEFENGTDPNSDDTDGDGFLDKYEIDYDVGSSPTGIDGQPPTITDFDADYELVKEISGPLWNLKIVVEYQVQIEISASDIFGIDWINVHLEGVGDEKIYCGGSTEVANKEFDFTLDAGQAVRSLFDSFEVNITAEDENENIGFKGGEVPSIKDLIIDSFFGALLSTVRILDLFLEELIDFVLSKISNTISDLLNPIISDMYDEANLKSINYDNSVSNIIGENFINALNIISNIINNILHPIEEYIDNIIEDMKGIIIDVMIILFNQIFGYEILNEDIANFDFLDLLVNTFTIPDFNELGFGNSLGNLLQSFFNFISFDNIAGVVNGGISSFTGSIGSILNIVNSNENYIESTKNYFLDLDTIWYAVTLLEIGYDIITSILLLGLLFVSCFVSSIPDPFEGFELAATAIITILCICQIAVIVLDLSSIVYFYNTLGIFGSNPNEYIKDWNNWIHVGSSFLFGAVIPLFSSFIGTVVSELTWGIIGFVAVPIIGSIIDSIDIFLGIYYSGDMLRNAIGI